MNVIGAIILAGICIVIGFLLGALAISLRREPKSKVPSLSGEADELRIWHKGKDKRLVIVLDGISYQRDTELNPEQSQRLIGLVSELQSWLGGVGEISDPSPKIASAFSPTPVDESSDRTRSPSLNPLQAFNLPRGSSEQTDQKEEDRSILAQIDDVLQEKLADTPLAARGIRMVEGPDRGMVIEVGLDRYTDIDAIPDENIRRVIRQSVADWENSMGEE